MDDTLKQILILLNGMQSDINGMKSDINEVKTDIHEIRTDVNGLKQGQKRLEDGQVTLQKNLIDSFGLYTEKILDYVDDKTEVLNKRIFKVESEMESLSRQ